MEHLTRRKFMGTMCAAGLAAGLLGGCSGGITGGNSTTLAYDFNAGKQGWVADVSDLPEDYEPVGFQLSYTHANLPAPLDTSKKALSLTSFNRSDDLWYFLKRQVTGLKPNTRYRVRFDVEIASNAPENAVGTLGAEGTDVVIKAGASAIEPSVRIETIGQTRTRVFNLDKGQQINGGRDVVVLGHVAIPGEEKIYKLKQLDNDHQRFFATTDSSGNLWAFFGTESGFEGLQTLYYTRFTLTLTPA